MEPGVRPVPALLVLGLSVPGCAGGKDDDSGPSETTVPTGAGQVAAVLASPPGWISPDSTCQIGIQTRDQSGDLEDAAGTFVTGREWASPDLQGQQGETFTLEADLSFCDLDHSRTSQPGAVVQEGVAHVLHHDGAVASEWGYAELVEDVDYAPGSARLTLTDGVDVGEIADAIETQTGATGLTYEDAGGGTWQLSWTSSTPFSRVLYLASTSPDYVNGEPEWIQVPDWW